MKFISKLFLSAAILSASTAAFAEKREIWHGWTDMPGIPCSKEHWYKDDFGIKWPTIKTAPQEYHTRIYIDVPTEGELLEKAKQCAVEAATYAGAAAFYVSPGSAWPVFKAKLMDCAKNKGEQIAENLLSVSAGTECRW